VGVLEELALRLKSGGMTPPNDEEVEALAPELWSCLTRTSYGEKHNVAPADLKNERVSGAYRVTVLVHAFRQQKRFTLLKLGDLVQEAEKALLNAEIPWEDAKSFKVKQDVVEAALKNA